MKERTALAVATICTAVALAGVPSWRDALVSPVHHAAVGGALTMVLLFVTRWLGPRGIRFERRLMAVFLAAMPVVYVASWFVRGGAGGEWLVLEVAALLVYGGLALLGLFRSPWLLVVGIAAHGLAWDTWHYHSAYIPTWYAVSCLVMDVGVALYLAARVPAWRRRAATRARPALASAAAG